MIKRIDFCGYVLILFFFWKPGCVYELSLDKLIEYTSHHIEWASAFGLTPYLTIFQSYKMKEMTYRWQVSSRDYTGPGQPIVALLLSAEFQAKTRPRIDPESTAPKFNPLPTILSGANLMAGVKSAWAGLTLTILVRDS